MSLVKVHIHANQTPFHLDGFAPRLVLKVFELRQKAIHYIRSLQFV